MTKMTRNGCMSLADGRWLMAVPKRRTANGLLETVPVADHRGNAILADFLAEVADVCIDGPRLHLIRHLPHLRQNAIARDYGRAVADEHEQQLQFLAGDPHLATVNIDPQCFGIDTKTAIVISR